MGMGISGQSAVGSRQLAIGSRQLATIRNLKTEDGLNETIILKTEGELKLFSRINPDEERIVKTEEINLKPETLI